MQNDQQISLLDSYLDGQLSKEESTNFEQRLATEPELKEAYRLHRVAREAISAHGALKNRIHTLSEEVRREEAQPKKSARIIRFTRWAAAAAAVLLLAVGYWFLSDLSPPLEEQMALYDQPQVQLRRGGAPAAFDKAYNEGDFQKAISIFESNPIKGAFAAAYAYRKTGNPQKALAMYDEIIQQKKNQTESDEAIWQKAITYINLNQKAEAKNQLKLLIDNPITNSTLRKQAKRLRSKL